jgi:two-component system, probable response regulator PhcQ
MAGYKILLIDDEPAILKALTRLLQYEGYTIRSTTNPQEVPDILRNEEFHLIISDHTMPGMTGIEVLRTARLTCPDAIRMMLTGNADLQITMDAINQGEIYRFLTKPWDNNDLLVTVRLGLREYDIQKHNKRLTKVVRRQAETIKRMKAQLSGAPAAKPTTPQKTSGTGVFKISDDELAALEKEYDL